MKINTWTNIWLSIFLSFYTGMITNIFHWFGAIEQFTAGQAAIVSFIITFIILMGINKDDGHNTHLTYNLF